jgi:hypothetical protein
MTKASACSILGSPENRDHSQRSRYQPGRVLLVAHPLQELGQVLTAPRQLPGLQLVPPHRVHGELDPGDRAVGGHDGVDPRPGARRPGRDSGQAARQLDRWWCHDPVVPQCDDTFPSPAGCDRRDDHHPSAVRAGGREARSSPILSGRFGRSQLRRRTSRVPHVVGVPLRTWCRATPPWAHPSPRPVCLPAHRPGAGSGCGPPRARFVPARSQPAGPGPSRLRARPPRLDD